MQETSMKQVTNNGSDCYLIRVNIFLGLLFSPDDGGDVFLRNVG
jgi:hypothetical protein